MELVVYRKYNEICLNFNTHCTHYINCIVENKIKKLKLFTDR